MAREARTHCKGCGVELVAENEERLVERVQAHVAEAHPGGHSPTREQVLSVIRSRSADDPE